MHGAIYMVESLANGKVYVGQTTTPLKQRWNAHVSAARKGRTPFYRAICKHGPRAFRVSRITACPDQKTLDAVERFWIGALGSLMPNGYNLTEGGGSGGRHAPDVCARKSEAQRARFARPGEREAQGRRMRAAWAEHPEAKAAQRAKFDAYWTPERRAAWAERMAPRLRAMPHKPAKPKPPRLDRRGTAVRVVTLATGEAQEYRSASAAARAVGMATSSVHYALQRGEPLNGFTFARKDS